MAEINHILTDQTLAEVDKALERKKAKEHPRHYLGMSEIGHECSRHLFYSFRNAETRVWNAKGVRATEDGYIQEDVMAERLRMVPGIKLLTEDPNKDPGSQIGFNMLLGHFLGHCDGMITGIKEAPTAWHIWEHKSCDNTGGNKYGKFLKAKETHGDKNALENWDYIYYCQGQIYMHCSQMTRHFITVTSPGGRNYSSTRTEYSAQTANYLIDKAQGIIFDPDFMPGKTCERPEYITCSWCAYKDLCHFDYFPLVHCKTCRYRECIKDGESRCLNDNSIIDKDMLNVGCNNHVYNPALIQAEILEQQRECTIFKNKNGAVFANCSATGFPTVKKDESLQLFTSKQLREDIKKLDSILPANSATAQVQKAFSGEIIVDDIPKRWETVKEFENKGE